MSKYQQKSFIDAFLFSAGGSISPSEEASSITQEAFQPLSSVVIIEFSPLIVVGQDTIT